MKILISLVGCDGTTLVLKNLSESEFTFLKELADETEERSLDSCCPILRIEEVDD